MNGCSCESVKVFLIRKCLDLRGTRTPNLRIQCLTPYAIQSRVHPENYPDICTFYASIFMHLRHYIFPFSFCLSIFITVVQFLPREMRQMLSILWSRIGRNNHNHGPCLTTATWCCRKNFSQWERSFLWKLRYHWLKRLRQRQITVVRQGPGVMMWQALNPDYVWELKTQNQCQGEMEGYFLLPTPCMEFCLRSLVYGMLWCGTCQFYPYPARLPYWHLGQSYLPASKASLKNMGKQITWIHSN